MSLRLSWTRFRLDPQYQNHRIACLMLVVSLLIGGTIYVGDFFKQKTKADALANVVDAELDSFQRVLDHGNSKEIVGFLEFMTDDVTQELPIRLENFNKRIVLAERLVEIGGTEQERETGLLDKLESSLSLVKLYQEFDVDLNKELDRLVRFSETLEAEASLNIRKHAATSVFFAEVEKHRRNLSSEADVRQAMIRAIELAPEDFELTDQIVRHLSHYASLKFDINNFLTSLLEQYSDVKNPKIVEMMDEIEMARFRREYNLTPLVAEEMKFLDSSYNESSKTAWDIIDLMETKSFVPDSTIIRLVNALTVILQSGKHDVNNEIFTEADVAFVNHNSNKEYQHFVQLRQIAESLGDKLTSQIKTVDDQNVPISNSEKPTLVIFVESRIDERAARILSDFSLSYRKLIQDNLLSVKTVFIENGDSDQQWLNVQAACEKVGLMEPVRINKKDNESLFNEMPVPWSPCWILIDHEGKLMDFNPLPSLLRARMHLYVQPNKVKKTINPDGRVTE